jgi:Cathepsin propeptide inhibitor domain (I29)
MDSDSSNYSQAQYGKKYANAEEDRLRFKTYLETRHMIVQHNTKFHKHQVGFELELNAFADIPESEYVSTILIASAQIKRS